MAADRAVAQKCFTTVNANTRCRIVLQPGGVRGPIVTTRRQSRNDDNRTVNAAPLLYARKYPPSLMLMKTLFSCQIGHALRGAGMECFRGGKTFMDECVPSFPNLEKVDFASIVSEDEGDNSDAEDHLCSMHAPQQKIPVRDHNDVSVPMRVNPSEDVFSQIPFRSLDSIGVTLDNSSENISSASERIRENHDSNSDGGTIVDKIPRRDHASDLCLGGELSSGCLDVTLSEVFMNFVKDEGDSADDEVISSIYPIASSGRWTYVKKLKEAAF